RQLALPLLPFHCPYAATAPQRACLHADRCSAQIRSSHPRPPCVPSAQALLSAVRGARAYPPGSDSLFLHSDSKRIIPFSNNLSSILLNVNIGNINLY